MKGSKLARIFVKVGEIYSLLFVCFLLVLLVIAILSGNKEVIPIAIGSFVTMFLIITEHFFSKKIEFSILYYLFVLLPLVIGVLWNGVL